MHEDQNVDREILEDLGVKSALLNEVVSLFSNHLKWFKEQPREWQKSVYSYIADSLEGFIKAGLLSKVQSRLHLRRLDDERKRTIVDELNRHYGSKNTTWYRFSKGFFEKSEKP